MSIDLEDMMEADGEAHDELRLPNDQELKELRELVQQQIDAEESISKQEELLKSMKQKLRTLSEKVIPEAMANFNMHELTTSDGLTIKIRDDVAASIKKDNEQAAFKWLRDHGFDDIIKNEVKIPFGKGQDEKAIQLAHLLEEHGFDSWSMKEGVHPQTLRGFIKEQLEQGHDVPLTLFGAYTYQKTVITQD